MRYFVLLAASLMPIVAWFSQRGTFGPDNGTISDQYPTLLVAQGYAFAIWGLIFLWDVAFSLWQVSAGDEGLNRVRPLAACGFLLTAVWMPIFSQQVFWLALVVIWMSLACLAACALSLSRLTSMPTRLRWLAWVPLSLHAGWLSLAAILNTAQVIVAYRLADTIPVLTWSLALFAVAAVLLLVLNASMRGNLAYTGVAAWGLIAVFAKQSSSPLPGAQVASWTAIAILAVLVAETLWLRIVALPTRRENRRSNGARGVVAGGSDERS